MRRRKRPRPLRDWDDIAEGASNLVISAAAGAATGLVTPGIVRAAYPAVARPTSVLAGVGVGIATAFITHKILAPAPKKGLVRKPIDTASCIKKYDSAVEAHQKVNNPNPSKNILGNIIAGVATGVATAWVAGKVFHPKKVYHFGRPHRK
jgi:hypothetical protein